MGKSKKKPLGEGYILADGEPLYLGNRYLAAVLAWLIPGAGHFYQRRYFKSAIFCTAVFSTFLIGMIVSGGRCVYASWNTTEKRWQYVLQAGNGFAAIPAGIQDMARHRGISPPLGNFMAGPDSIRDLDDWHHDTASGFDMGTLYTMISGLLNILIVFDAFSGPLPPPVPKTRTEGETDDAEEAEEGADDGPPKKASAKKQSHSTKKESTGG